MCTFSEIYIKYIKIQDRKGMNYKKTCLLRCIYIYEYKDAIAYLS